MIEIRTPDIIVIVKNESNEIITDIGVPIDIRKRGKMEKYQDLKREIGRLRKLEMVEVMPAVIIRGLK